MTVKEIERFRRAQALFDAALEYTAGPERDALLNRETAGDHSLLQEVQQLLVNDERVNASVPRRSSALPAFGTWQAIRLLGRGGMGVVYLAERADGAFHMRAAVKVVPLALASADIEDRFRRERQFLASLEHPKIARLIDGGLTSAGLPFLVMEYVDGHPIDRYCDAQGLDRRGRIGLMRQVLEALTYVHGQQVIHRDVKSSNILVDAAGNARLLDFGTARLVDSGDTAITRTGVFAFTPECASPEQVQGKPVTFASDIYSAGVLLYRLLTGRPPYPLPDDPGAIAHTIIQREPEASGLDRSLDAILKKALRKNPDQRYQSAAEMDAELTRYLQGRPVRARRPSKAGVLALAIASASVCAGAGWVAATKPGGIAQFLPWARGGYVTSTVAGVGRPRFAGSGAPAIYADLVWPQYLAADSAGNIFLTDTFYNHVLRISSDGVITVYAGTGEEGRGGDNGPATAAQLNQPLGIGMDADGNLFIMDNENARLRKVTPDGIISTLAGLKGGCVAVDPAGNVYVSETLPSIIHKVSPGGVVTTFAGTGKAGFSGDGGRAIDAELYNPTGIRADGSGNLYVADTGNNRVRKITPEGIISTVAGDGAAGFGGDGRPAVNASLRDVVDVAAGADGSIYIVDRGNARIRVVDPRGVISTFAGGMPGGPRGTLVGDGPAVEAKMHGVVAIAVEHTGSLVAAVAGDRQVRRITPPTITTIAGVLPRAEVVDNMPATSARLVGPYGVAIDRGGEIYVSDPKDARIRKINTAGIITTIAGNGLPGQSPDGGPATLAGGVGALALDLADNLYYTAGSIIRRLARDGTVRTIAGSAPGFYGDSGPAIEARLSSPGGLAVDGQGNLYVADSNNHRIRRIDGATGKIATIAGIGIAAYGGDGGPATAAELSRPNQLAFDKHGNLYISDTGNNRIRRISPDGTITTVAGNGTFGDTGDGGDAAAAQLIQPTAIAVDEADNLYIAPWFGPRIRKVDGATHRITSIADRGAAASEVAWDRRCPRRCIQWQPWSSTAREIFISLIAGIVCCANSHHFKEHARNGASVPPILVLLDASRGAWQDRPPIDPRQS